MRPQLGAALLVFACATPALAEVNCVGGECTLTCNGSWDVWSGLDVLEAPLGYELWSDEGCHVSIQGLSQNWSDHRVTALLPGSEGMLNVSAMVGFTDIRVHPGWIQYKTNCWAGCNAEKNLPIVANAGWSLLVGANDLDGSMLLGYAGAPNGFEGGLDLFWDYCTPGAEPENLSMLALVYVDPKGRAHYAHRFVPVMPRANGSLIALQLNTYQKPGLIEAWLRASYVSGGQSIVEDLLFEFEGNLSLIGRAGLRPSTSPQIICSGYYARPWFGLTTTIVRAGY